MKTTYSTDELTWRCSDFAEHVDSVIAHVNAGNVVTYEKTQIDTAMVFLAMIEDNIDEALAIFTRMIPANVEDAKVIDDKTQELAEEAARSYKGQYNG
ncbi:MAG: hypothetical protein JKY81_00205 [Colwellia sp.]|nr:hypothetical protein [Colwellia sp.]